MTEVSLYYLSTPAASRLYAENSRVYSTPSRLDHEASPLIPEPVRITSLQQRISDLRQLGGLHNQDRSDSLTLLTRLTRGSLHVHVIESGAM